LARLDEFPLARAASTVELSAVEYILASFTANQLSGISLSVEVYSYEETSEVWLLLSQHFLSEGRDGWPTQSVALSDDGTVVAIGSMMDGIPGVQVYSWDGTGLKERGKRLVGDNDEDRLGWSVDLSSDGSIVAAGTDSNNSTSAIRAFKWNGADYEQLWNDIPSLSGVTTALAISDDGSVVAVGLPLSKDVARGGEVKVYGFVSDCPSGTTRVRVSVTTNQSEQPHRWTLTGSSGDILLEGHTRVQEMTFVYEICVNHDNDCLTFTMYHEGRGDGIKQPGGYTIIIGEEEAIKSVISTDFFSRHRFGNCDQLCKDDESHLRFAFHTVSPLETLPFNGLCSTSRIRSSLKAVRIQISALLLKTIVFHQANVLHFEGLRWRVVLFL
jgi:hypothetical protein